MTDTELAKRQLADFAAGLKSFGMKTAAPRFSGGTERYCEVASWRDAKGKDIEVCVYVAPYLRTRPTFWAGFCSMSADPITRISDAYAALHLDDIPKIDSRHWDAGVRLKLPQRRSLVASGGVALEGYGPGRYNWFGIYLPLDGNAADQAYSFVTDIMSAHPQAVGENNTGKTEREARRKERSSQGRFRTDQMKVWGKACIVTGCRVEAALQASHIVGWQIDKSDEMRKSPDNGLLMTGTLHLLFDDGLISFDDDGAMLSKLLPTESKRLGIDEPMRIEAPLNVVQRRNLARHRKAHGFP